MKTNVRPRGRSAPPAAAGGSGDAIDAVRALSALDALAVAALLAALYGVLHWTAQSPAALYATVAILALPLFVGPQLVLALVERLIVPAGPRKSLRNWILHLKIHLLSALVQALMAALTFVIVAWLSQRWGIRIGLIDLRVADGKGILFLVLALIIVTLIADFFFYWMHRMMHRNQFFWNHHKLHHMDRHFDALTSWRQNWIEWPINLLFILVPMALLFRLDTLDPVKLGVLNGTVIFVLGSLRLINHFNTRLEYGRASVLVVGPQVHRIHHSCLPQHQDRNFCAYFPIWDILFGTYYHPRPGEFPPTGVDGEDDIISFWQSQTFSQREWWKMACAWRARSSNERCG